MRAMAASASARTSHSHTTHTRQPISASTAMLAASRAAFLASFAAHQSRRVAGRTAFLQAGSAWRCQKHPRTSMTARRAGRTMSGLPGSSFTCSLYL